MQRNSRVLSKQALGKLNAKRIAVFFAILLFAGTGVFAIIRLRGASGTEQAARARSQTRLNIEEHNVIEDVLQWPLPQIPQGQGWFRSNASGMILERSPSRSEALLNPYALFVYRTGPQDLPDLIRPFFNANFLIEVRVLYKDGEEFRRQWIFRSAGRNRLVAVFASEPEPEACELDENGSALAETVIHPNGSIEIYNANGFLTEEHLFHSDGSITKRFFYYAGGVLIRAETWRQTLCEEGPVMAKLYTDHFRYNRSRFLRSVERVFHEEQRIEIGDGTIRVAFPRHIEDIVAVNAAFIEEAALTQIPEFFGNITASEGYSAVFSTDERSRVLSQTMVDDDGNIVFTIYNTWVGDRITSMRKLEGGYEFLTEFEFDADGNRIVERNLRNGVLERVVRTQGNREIEEIYLNNVLVLEAIWEYGRKISEVRVNR